MNWRPAEPFGQQKCGTMLPVPTPDWTVVIVPDSLRRILPFCTVSSTSAPAELFPTAAPLPGSVEVFPNPWSVHVGVSAAGLLVVNTSPWALLVVSPNAITNRLPSEE